MGTHWGLMGSVVSGDVDEVIPFVVCVLHSTSYALGGGGRPMYTACVRRGHECPVPAQPDGVLVVKSGVPGPT
jgi:hypothetical protein